MHRFSAVLLLSCLALSGCTYVVDIKGEDRNVYLPEGEIAISLPSSRKYKGSRRREDTLAAGYSRGKGTFDQTLRAYESVYLDGTQISGPVELNHEADLGVAYLRFARHMYKSEHFEWYWGAGLGHAELDFTIRDGSSKTTVESRSTGGHGLVGLTYYFAPKVGIETSAGGYLFYLGDNAFLNDFRAQLVVTPTDHLRLFAGYRYWGYRTQPRLIESDIRFDFYGPTAGATLRF